MGVSTSAASSEDRKLSKWRLQYYNPALESSFLCESYLKDGHRLRIAAWISTALSILLVVQSVLANEPQLIVILWTVFIALLVALLLYLIAVPWVWGHYVCRASPTPACRPL